MSACLQLHRGKIKLFLRLQSLSIQKLRIIKVGLSVIFLSVLMTPPPLGFI